MHFEGFNFHRYFFRLAKVFEVGDKVVDGLGLDDHVIYVSFDIAADLLVEAHLDGPLIGRPGVLESEGHGGVAVRPKRRDERRLDLVFFLEEDLVIAGVTIKERE